MSSRTFREKALTAPTRRELVRQLIDRGLSEPGKPNQNAYVECCDRTVRYGGLNQYAFEEIEQVQETATRWLWTYNNGHPNMALGGITPTRKSARAAQLHFWQPPKAEGLPNHAGLVPYDRLVS